MKVRSQKTLSSCVARSRRRIEFAVTIYGVLSLLITHSQSQSNTEDTDSLIFGGAPATIEEFPFLVSLQYPYPYQHGCGGALLSSFVVISACHCTASYDRTTKILTPYNWTGFTIFAGTENHGNEGSGERRDVIKYIPHPKCERNRHGMIYDFGIIVVKNEFPIISGKIEIVPLPDIQKISFEKLSKCWTAGFGATEADNERVSLQLLKIDMKKFSSDECKKLSEEEAEHTFLAVILDPEFQTCTVGLENTTGICRGDSGGPLVCDDGSGNRVLTGTASGGNKCFGGTFVWARVDIAIPWIKEQLASASQYTTTTTDEYKKNTEEHNTNTEEYNKNTGSTGGITDGNPDASRHENPEESKSDENTADKVSAGHVMILPSIIYYTYILN